MHEAILEEILEQRVASSRGLRKPRGVKRKQTKFPVIRSRIRTEATSIATIEVLK